MIQGGFPIADRLGPLLRGFVDRHVHDLQGRLLVPVDFPIASQLANYTVDQFDRVGCRDRLADEEDVVLSAFESFYRALDVSWPSGPGRLRTVPQSRNAV